MNTDGDAISAVADGASSDLLDASSAFDALADLPSEASRSCTIKINEVETGGQSATDEFVELFNTCGDLAVSLAGYKLVYRSDVGTTDNLRVAFMTEAFVAGRPYIVCANAAFAGPADARFTDGLKAEGGGLALRDPGGTIIDSVGWGTATNDFVEGKPAPAPLPGQSIAREPNGKDTNDNAADFVIRGAGPSPGTSNAP